MENPKIESNDLDKTSPKLAANNENTQENPVNNQNSVIPDFQKINIPNEILDLLWFADGPLKNFDYDKEKKTIIETNPKIMTFPEQEMSVILTELPINFKTTLSPLDNLQCSLPARYQSLNPDERYVYLNWLKNIKESVNISYVFLFYYGLERHLVLGKYKEAVDTIFTLRKYHDYHRFILYSNHALIHAAMNHNDEETLIRVLDTLRDPGCPYDDYENRWILLSKYRLKFDLSPDDVLSLSSQVGLRKESTDIKYYYPLFKEYLIKELMKEYGKPSFPFCDIEMRIPKVRESVYANHSIPGIGDIEIPSIIDSPQFEQAVYSLLVKVRDSVKQIPPKGKKEYMKKWLAAIVKEKENCNDNDHH